MNANNHLVLMAAILIAGLPLSTANALTPTTQTPPATSQSTSLPTAPGNNLNTQALGPEQPSLCDHSLFQGAEPTISRAAMQKNTSKLCYSSYAVLESSVIKGPVWSAEYITSTDVLTGAKLLKRGKYQIDPNIPADEQGSLDEYSIAHYDRGRLASADGGTTDTDRNDRSTLANVLPIIPSLNRGVWHAIEHATRDLAEADQGIYVVTGPDFHGDKITSIEPSSILIPTSIWKAIYDPAKQSTGVYVCTNLAIPKCHIVSVLDLIAETGIDPFPSVPAYEKATAMTLPEPEASDPGPE